MFYLYDANIISWKDQLQHINDARCISRFHAKWVRLCSWKNTRKYHVDTKVDGKKMEAKETREYH
jgi:hypothetical protein